MTIDQGLNEQERLVAERLEILSGLIRKEERVISEQIETGKTSSIGSGRSASVEMLDLMSTLDQEGVSRWVVKIEDQKTKEQRELGLDMEDEFTLHQQAIRILETAQDRNPEKKYAKIPQVIGLMEKSDKPTMLIEYVEGDTLFERAIKEFLIIRTVVNPDSEEGMKEIADIRADSKEELINRLYDEEVVNLLPARYSFEIKREGGEFDETAFIGIALDVNSSKKNEASKILSGDQYEALENTIKLLNAAGFYHRDLHPSNIILGLDGSISIIDFGLSKYVSKKGSETSVYFEGTSSARSVKLISDTDMLDQYYKIARKRGLAAK